MTGPTDLGVYRTLAFWMQTRGAALITVKRRSLVCVWAAWSGRLEHAQVAVFRCCTGLPFFRRLCGSRQVHHSPADRAIRLARAPRRPGLSPGVHSRC